MKTGIHPNYTNDVVVTCACGNTFKTGSTINAINVEICSKCHPFWSGIDKTIDTAGRVDRFKKRVVKTETKKVSKKK